MIFHENSPARRNPGKKRGPNFRKTFLKCRKFRFSNFPPFGRGKWVPVQNFGVLEKICNYISSKKQKLKRFRKLEAPNGVRKRRKRGKRRQNLRKVCEKCGSRYGGTLRPIVIHLTRAFRQPCHGSVAPRTPIFGIFLVHFWTL